MQDKLPVPVVARTVDLPTRTRLFRLLPLHAPLAVVSIGWPDFDARASADIDRDAAVMFIMTVV